jgi:hypothetical protein
LGHKGLDQEGIGGDDAVIGGQRRGALDGVEAVGDDIRVAYVVVAEEAFQSRASRQLYGLEGRPLGEEVAKEGGIFVVEPLQHMRKVVFQGTSEAICDAYLVADQAAAMFHELFKGAHGRTLGLKGAELIAMLEQEFKEEFGVSGVVLGLAGGEGLAIPREGEWVNGKEHEAVILPQRGDDGAFVEFETDGNGLCLESRAQGAHPLVNGVWLVFEDTELTFLRAGCLQADIVFGISPVDADKGRKLFYR